MRFRAQTRSYRQLRVNGATESHVTLITKPAVEKIPQYWELLAGISKMRASNANLGYVCVCIFHQAKELLGASDRHLNIIIVEFLSLAAGAGAELT